MVDVRALGGRPGVEVVVPVLNPHRGELPQRQIGVGWAALRALPPPAAGDPTLTVIEVDAALTANTVTSMPAKVMSIPAACVLDGFSFSSSVDATSDTTGIQAKKTALSDAVVYRTPTVSEI